MYQGVCFGIIPIMWHVTLNQDKQNDVLKGVHGVPEKETAEVKNNYSVCHMITVGEMQPGRNMWCNDG